MQPIKFIHTVTGTVLLVALLCFFSNSLFAQNASPEEPTNLTQTTTTTQKNDIGPTTSEKIAAGGENFAKKIDSLGNGASAYVGDWIKTEAFMGITWLTIVISFLLLMLVVIAERMASYFLDRRIKKRFGIEPQYKTIVSIWDSISKPLSLFILVYGSFWSLSPILIHFKTTEGLNIVYLVASKAADFAGYIAIFWFIYRLVKVFEVYLSSKAAKTDSDLDDLIVPLLGKTIRIFVVIIGAAIILRGLTGLNLGPMLASLGIGGIAVAFAARDSIANFFGSLTIIFDKPFSVGERIVIENYDGVVEEVGFRSTRIRLLNGHQVSIPNEKVVNTPLENIGRRPHIRWYTNITITYDTPVEKVEKAVKIIEEVLENHEGMRPDFPPRVYFNGFNDWSLNIAVFAWYHPPDYWDYQSWLQKTCLEILSRFNEEGIDFAFPSQTVYMANDDARQLKLKLLKGDTH